MKFTNLIKYRPGDKVESWDEIYVGMKVYYWGDKDQVLAEVKEIKHGGGVYGLEGEAVIEFSKKPKGLGVHNCCGKIPSGLGYLVSFSNLLLKAEETY